MNRYFAQVLWVLTVFLLTVCSNRVFAARPEGFGAVATHLMDPVGLASDFVYTACIIIGSSFVFASVIKYIEHRRSPLMVPISTPVFLLIAGVVLVLMPFLSLLSDSAVRYSLFR